MAAPTITLDTVIEALRSMPAEDRRATWEQWCTIRDLINESPLPEPDPTGDGVNRPYPPGPEPQDRGGAA